MSQPAQNLARPINSPLIRGNNVLCKVEANGRMLNLFMIPEIQFVTLY